MEEQLIRELEAFGLNEKEAHIYTLLLKYGPKTSGELTKLLRSYRMDVYRTLETLDEKGMIEVSMENPTKYAAAPIVTAIDAAIEKQSYGLRWMQDRKSHVVEAAKGFPSVHISSAVDDVTKLKVIKGRANAVAALAQLVNLTERDIMTIISPFGLPVISLSGQLEHLIAAANRGVRVRCITDIVPQNLNAAREAYPSIELCHLGGYNGAEFLVTDSRESFTTIKFDATHRMKDADDVLFWTNSTEYALHLEASFEYLWRQSIDAAERINELLVEHPNLFTQTE